MTKYKDEIEAISKASVGIVALILLSQMFFYIWEPEVVTETEFKTVNKNFVFGNITEKISIHKFGHQRSQYYFEIENLHWIQIIEPTYNKYNETDFFNGDLSF